LLKPIASSLTDFITAINDAFGAVVALISILSGFVFLIHQFVSLKNEVIFLRRKVQELEGFTKDIQESVQNLNYNFTKSSNLPDEVHRNVSRIEGLEHEITKLKVYIEQLRGNNDRQH
jgi:uncharacterized protein YlxW (UPF0749 family)